jgi:squalene-hopene/tetraprenyl-beta-curcumene cyclase
MGIARHRNAPSRNPFARGIRNFSEPRAVRVLTRIQPENGGFLEATPLTSFVVMSLAASDYSDHPVARKGIAFLRQAQREDGSWPIDTDLATWLSTMSVSALGTNITDSGGRLRDWLLNQQYRVLHPYTNAAPGGWAWTDLPGGVPDADDTAGALLALHSLGSDHAESLAAAKLGIDWLLSLQNRDGGIPTFCRGWGKLPFDHSSADITAHALRAWSAWMPRLDSTTQARVKAAARKAIRFLIREQQSSGPAAGAWAPLWFGNEHNPDEINWTYGTARVLLALAPAADSFHIRPQVLKAAEWLIHTQNADGGWGGGSPNTESSVEETGLAVESLAEFLQNDTEELKSQALTAALRGAEWLITRIEDGSWTTAAPIGFYFAKLWYYERLYPMIMTTAALQKLTECH